MVMGVDDRVHAGMNTGESPLNARKEIALTTPFFIARERTDGVERNQPSDYDVSRGFIAMSEGNPLKPSQPANATNVPHYADELPDACPPGDAVDATGTFYATHRVLPPNGNDFLTAAARNSFPGQNECKRRGNSVMASLDDARHLCRAHPDVHVFVSEGALNAAHGKLLEDGSRRYPSHHTLWRYAGVTMHGIFIKVV
jgi:hypothetical protein